VFATTVNQLKGKITILFIAHQIPAALKVDATIQIGDVSEEKEGASKQERVFTPAAG
jgi:subfamily B ATP-binding cassette protein HlyB/CyaB